jgi:restriction endonuclease S subunit
VVPVVAGGLEPAYYHNVANRPSGAITISGSGANSGHVARWDTPIFASDCTTVISDGRIVEQNFVFYFLKAQQSYIQRELRRGAAQPHVYAKDLAQLEILIPPLAEQRRIVAKLDEVDADLRTLSECLDAELLRSLKIQRSVLIDMLSASSGQMLTLGSVATISAGNSAPQDKSLFIGGTHTFIRTSDVGLIRVGEISDSADKLNEHGVRGMRKFRAGVTLVPKSGASTFNNHRVITTVESTISSHLAVVDADRAVLSDRFVYYYLQTVRAQDLIGDQSYPSLNLTHLENVEISVPPLAEQQRIVAKIDGMQSVCTEVSTNIERRKVKARELRQSVLEAAFKGEL